MPRNLVVWQKLTTNFKGHTIEGNYGVDQEMVTVRYEELEKTTQIGGSPPIVIAKLLLRELANEAEKDQR